MKIITTSIVHNFFFLSFLLFFYGLLFVTTYFSITLESIVSPRYQEILFVRFYFDQQNYNKFSFYFFLSFYLFPVCVRFTSISFIHFTSLFLSRFHRFFVVVLSLGILWIQLTQFFLLFRYFWLTINP